MIQKKRAFIAIVVGIPIIGLLVWLGVRLVRVLRGKLVLG